MVTNRIEGNCINLDKSLGFITIQFKLDSLRGVSNLIKKIPPETYHQRDVRQNRNDGSGVRSIVGNISITELLNDLSRHWCHLISATSQKREQGGNKYFLVKYIFAGGGCDNDNTLDSLRDVRGEILSNLKRACVHTVWLGDVWINPLYKENKVIKGMNTVCINLGLHKDTKPAKGYKKVKILKATFVKPKKPKPSFASQPVIANEMLEKMYAVCPS